MSKFFPDIPDAAELERLAPAHRRITPKKKPAPLTTERGCDGCPLKPTWRTNSTPKMPMSGGKKADILVLGTGPSQFDDTRGDHFRDTYGKLLRKAISPRHHDRLAYNYLTRCHSFSGITPQAVHSCSVHLEKDMERMPIKAIIGVGQGVLRRFFPDGKVGQVFMLYGLRMVVEIGGHLYWYFPVYDLSNLPNMKPEDDPSRSADYTVMKADLRQFFKDVDKWGTPTRAKIDPKCVQMPQTLKEAKTLIDQLKGKIGLDFEGNRLKPYMHGAKMISAAVSDGKTTIAWSVGHSEQYNSWGMEAVRYAVTKFHWIAHNAAMEYLWLRYYFPDADIKPFDDTRALARDIYNRNSGTSLAAVSRLELGVNLKELNDLVVTRLDDYPVEHVLVYNGLDALGCALIYPKMINRVNISNYNRINQATEATVEMELMGLTVDQTAAKKLKLEWQALVDAAERKAHKVYEVKAWEAEHGKEFSISSNKQIADVLVNFAHIRLPLTPKGEYATSEPILKELAGDHPLILAVLDYREAAKQISTYIDPCIAVTTLYPDKLLHPSYTTMHTSTFRLSSEDPNIQNFPNRRHKQIRRLIKAPPRHVLVPMDYGQVEARVIAMASRDQLLIDSILRGEDIHSFWLNKLLDLYPEYLERLADKTNETDEKKIRKGGRGIIKTDFVFATFYGSTPKSCAAKTGVPLPVMVELSTELWRKHHGVKKWQDMQRKNYETTASIVGLTGHDRHGPVPGNEMINTPIQSVAGDIMVDAMNELSRLSRAEKDPYLHPRMSIHDDLTFIFPDSDREIEAYMMRIFPIMTKVRYDWQIVPLMVEAKIGKNWCDIEELMEYTGDYVK